MKKKSLILLITMLLPLSVKADMSGPETLPYYVTPKENGVICVINEFENGENKETNYELSYGQNYKVSYDYIGDNNTINIYYTDNDDCSVDIGDINFVEYTKIPKIEYEGFVMSKDGLNVYSGPSSLYEKIGSLKQFDEIKIGYADDFEYSYAYIEANGIKGWISVLDKSIAVKEKNDIDAILLDRVEAENIKTGTKSIIDAQTKITIKYSLDYYDTYILIEKDGNLLSIFNNYIVNIGNNAYIKLNKDVKLYKNVGSGDKESVVLSTIPKDTILQVEYYGEDQGCYYSYVNYNGTYGFVYYIDYEEETKPYYFSDKDGNEITYDEFIKNANTSVTKSEDTPEETEKEEEKSKDVKEKINQDYLLIIYVAIGVFLLVIVSIVTMLLINKKMKKKNLKEENKNIIKKDSLKNNVEENNNEIKREVEEDKDEKDE